MGLEGNADAGGDVGDCVGTEGKADANNIVLLHSARGRRDDKKGGVVRLHDDIIGCTRVASLDCCGLLIRFHRRPGCGCISAFVERVAFMGRHLDDPGQYLLSRALVKPRDKAFEERLLRVSVEPLWPVPALKVL